MSRRRSILIALAVPVVVAITAQAADPDPAQVRAAIRAEALSHSQTGSVFDKLTVEIGPRLTNSPAFKRAVDFAQSQLSSWGLENVHAEPWKFGRGWTLNKLAVEMVEPRYAPLIGYAEAWSPSTA